jgi:hypothetical protein
MISKNPKGCQDRRYDLLIRQIGMGVVHYSAYNLIAQSFPVCRCIDVNAPIGSQPCLIENRLKRAQLLWIDRAQVIPHRTHL